METKMADIRVAVLVVTYNHEKYIRQCIESALAQQTDFAVDIIVGNDCSTDKTACVLQDLQAKHSNLKVFNRTQNMGLVNNTTDLFRFVLAQNYTYAAMLDGDDYWCDNGKLQRQVTLMEQYPAMSFCYMRCTSSEEVALEAKSSTYAIRVEDMFDKIRSTGISNGTVMHRVSMLKNVPFDKIAAEHLLSMDYPTNVYMARQGLVGFIDGVSLYWRRTGNTVSSSGEKQKALRYIDHEVRQGLFLAREFPNTAYSFSKEEAEQFRQWQIYEWALSRKDYSTIIECLHNSDFPSRWLEGRQEKKYLNSRIEFNIYIYLIKKIKTVWRMICDKLKQ